MQEQKYAPLSDQALAALHQPASADFGRMLATIRGLLETVKLYRHLSEPAKYKGVLYPADALRLLEYAREFPWPGRPSADDTISAYISDWCERTQPVTPREYVEKVFAACRELGCLDAAFDRLNLLAIALPEQDRITISTSQGSTSKIQRHNGLSSAGRLRAVEFLRSQHHFEQNISLLYDRLERWNRHATLEACLLSWIGSLTLKSLLSKAASPVLLTGNDMLVLAEK